MNIVVGPHPRAPCISLLLHGHDNIRMECVSAHTCGLGTEMGGGGFILMDFYYVLFCCCLQNSNKTTYIHSVPLSVSLSLSLSYRVEIRLYEELIFVL
jgi:hypothetical protein